MRVLAVPGYGDTAKYWAAPVGQILDCPVAWLTWPGMWGAAPSDQPIASMLESLAAGVDDQTILVGHSLGCRIILSCLERIRPKAVVLTAPALGPLSFMTPDVLATWEAVGHRSSSRPDPVTSARVTLDVPFSFAQGIAQLRAPLLVPAGVECVLLSADDTRHNQVTRGLATGLVSEVDGPHRWWEDASSTDGVLAEIVRAAPDDI